MKKELVRRMLETEQEILACFPGKTKDDLVDLRGIVGQQYLVRKYGYKKACIMWKKQEFWAWWLIVWIMNDRDVLDFLSIEKDTYITWDDYAEGQLAKTLHKYTMSEREIKQLQQEEPQLEVTT